MGPIDWALPLVLWIYGLLFWFNSEGIHLFKAKKWEWTEEAIEEQQRYMSDTRIASRRFWKKWWVRFPIGLLFMSVGIHALFSRDFTAQWLSFILLMSAFVTPFVFIAELAMLPLAILIVLGFMAVVTLTPTSVIIMLAVLAMFATVVLAQNVRASQLQKPVRKKKEDQETKDKEGEEGKDAEGATAGSNASAAAPVGAEAGPAMPPPPPSLADETAAAVAESAAAREEARAAAAEEREASVAAAKASAEERVAAAQSAAAEAAQERAAARAELSGDAAAGTEADAAPPPTDTADTPVK
jgi:membrane protein implicated in regulation of membrane protease activity